MREICARVTGFNYSTHHAYTTEVEVDNRTWSLAIRYRTFYEFYTRLAALEKHFTVAFPPKGGIFFSPPPDERQEQLDDFLLSTLTYFDMRGHPKRMEALLNELLQISQHLEFKDDEERTASEGSSVVEELLLDTPMPSHDPDDFFESDHEDGTRKVLHDSITSSRILERAKHANDKVRVAKTDELPFKLEKNSKVMVAEPEEEPEIATEVMLSKESETSLIKRRPSQGRTGGTVANDSVATLRRKILLNGAMQAAVVSTMKPNVNMVEQRVETMEGKMTQSAEGPNVPIQKRAKSQDHHAEVKAKSATFGKRGMQPETVVVKAKLTIAEIPEPALEVSKDVIPASRNPHMSVGEESLKANFLSIVDNKLDADKMMPAKVRMPESEGLSEAKAKIVVTSARQEESFIKEKGAKVVNELDTKKAEAENPVVRWIRRIGTFGVSAADTIAQDQVVARGRQDKNAIMRSKAEKKTQEEVVESEVEAKEAADAMRAAKAELLRAEQDLSRRLNRYRYPTYFQTFSCNMRASNLFLQCRGGMAG